MPVQDEVLKLAEHLDIRAFETCEVYRKIEELEVE